MRDAIMILGSGIMIFIISLFLRKKWIRSIDERVLVSDRPFVSYSYLMFSKLIIPSTVTLAASALFYHSDYMVLFLIFGITGYCLFVIAFFNMVAIMAIFNGSRSDYLNRRRRHQRFYLYGVSLFSIILLFMGAYFISFGDLL